MKSISNQTFKKKTARLLLAVLLLCTFLSAFLTLTAEAEISVVGVSSETVKGKAEVETKLNVTSDGFVRMKLTFSYDTAHFSLLSVKSGNGNVTASLLGEEEKDTVVLTSLSDFTGELPLTLHFSVENGTAAGNYPLEIRSSSAVNDAGTLVAVNCGECSIGIEKDVKYVEKIVFESENIEIKKNEYAQLELTFEPADAANSALVYKSSDPKVATVTSSGKITALAFGKTTVTVSSPDGSVFAQIEVTVPEFTAWEEFVIVFRSLNKGFLQTLKLFGVTLLGAIPLGLLISFGSMSKFKPLSAFVKVIVWIIRGSPLMIQLMIIFYFPGMVFNNNIWGQGETGRFIAACVAFIVNYACYFSEIFRGGIQGVPKGQTEAGQVLGMTGSQIFFKVKLLQMIKRIVPPMSNEIITLVKDTSLARIIALQEIIWAGDSFMKGSNGISGAIWPLFFTAVYYLVFSGIVTVLLNKLEKRLAYFN